MTRDTKNDIIIWLRKDKRLADFRLLGVGFFIGFCILGGVLGGVWLDGRFGAGPVFTLVGLLLGLVLASGGVYRMLIPLLRNRDDEEEK